MKIRYFIVLLFISLGCENKIQKHPNIVLIMMDDMNDYPEVFDGHPQAKTPNIKRLAESGTSFLRAYTNNPICGPSRSSFLSGIYPHNSSNFWQESWLKNEVLSNTYSKILSEAEKTTDRNSQIEIARNTWSKGFVAEYIDEFI